MPVKSEAQRRAMYAALAGHSTLGIPKSVAAKFVGPEAHDMAPEEMDALRTGLRKFFTEEAAEGEHDPAELSELSKLLTKFFGEEAKESAHAKDAKKPEHILTLELNEGDHVKSLANFLAEVAHRANVGHSFALEADREDGGDGGVRTGIDGDGGNYIHRVLLDGKEVKRPAAQDACAFDEASVRSYDKDGRLRVEKAHISKANICPYYGREIPGFEKLGLEPDRIYQLFRDPEELKKAAPSFNNIQILLRHIPTSPDDPQKDVWVGTTGTDAEFNDPYLDNSLAFHVRDGIDAVESNEQKELSAGYYYDPDMTPGEYMGQKYDGVMRNLVANHLCLVREGRAGSDVVVGDTAIPQLKDMITMTSKTPTVLSRKAVLTRGALLVHLRPKLAQDAKIDLTPILAPVSAKNFKASIPAIIAGVSEATKGKMAKDAELGDLTQFLNALEEVDEAEGIDADPNSGLPMAALPEKKEEGKDAAVGMEKLAAYLKSVGLDDAEIAEALKMCAPGATDAEPEKKPDCEGKKEEMVSKPAMDAAIAAAVKAAEENAVRRHNSIREAEEAVRPYVGALAMAHDSAEGVYRTALTTLDMDEKETKDLPLAALKAILKAQPVPGARKVSVPLAQDEGASKSFATRFPGADRIINA